MRKHAVTILLILILLIGVGLILYPTVSDWYNSRHQSRAIASYAEKVNNLDEENLEAIREEARIYNQMLTETEDITVLNEQRLEEYEKILDVTGTGIMSYIEIPAIDVSLPVYHGVEESVLQVAAGHIEWSSLPVGGENTHCVVSGHRGLPSAKLFTNLDKLEIGDIFMLNTLGETLTYKIDLILIVEPYELESLVIEQGKDLCTLVTCTPYGVNSHRLLVRGQRTENPEEDTELMVVAEAGQIDQLIVAPIVALPMLLVFTVYVMIKYRKKK